MNDNLKLQGKIALDEMILHGNGEIVRGSFNVVLYTVYSFVSKIIKLNLSKVVVVLTDT